MNNQNTTVGIFQGMSAARYEVTTKQGAKVAIMLSFTQKLDEAESFSFSQPGRSISLELTVDTIVGIYHVLRGKADVITQVDKRGEGRMFNMTRDNDCVNSTMKEGNRTIDISVKRGHALELLNACMQYFRRRFVGLEVILIDQWLQDIMPLDQKMERHKTGKKSLSKPQEKALWSIFYNKWEDNCPETVNYIIQTFSYDEAFDLIGQLNDGDFSLLNKTKAMLNNK